MLSTERRLAQRTRASRRIRCCKSIDEWGAIEESLRRHRLARRLCRFRRACGKEAVDASQLIGHARQSLGEASFEMPCKLSVFQHLRVDGRAGDLQAMQAIARH